MRARHGGGRAPRSVHRSYVGTTQHKEHKLEDKRRGSTGKARSTWRLQKRWFERIQ